MPLVEVHDFHAGQGSEEGKESRFRLIAAGRRQNDLRPFVLRFPDSSKKNVDHAFETSGERLRLRGEAGDDLNLAPDPQVFVMMLESLGAEASFGRFGAEKKEGIIGADFEPVESMDLSGRRCRIRPAEPMDDVGLRRQILTVFPSAPGTVIAVG
ncbi:MAG TPA: hypothetical protein VNO22_00370 [Planctomycetota bacterium]|nr:hypothetical protein [Planctomycetota bacterium]